MRALRRIAVLAAVLAALALAACAPLKSGPPAISFSNANPQAQELYYLVNNERAANGLGPVGWHDEPGGLAQGWSDHWPAPATTRTRTSTRCCRTRRSRA